VPRLRVVAVAARLPAWAEEACAEYAKRMPRGYEIERIFVKKEPAALAGCVALDERGRDMTTRQFAALLGKERTFVIGGPDGLSDKLKRNAEELVRISSLTLPHALAQVVPLEQIYRAATILTSHPYHRE